MPTLAGGVDRLQAVLTGSVEVTLALRVQEAQSLQPTFLGRKVDWSGTWKGGGGNTEKGRHSVATS